MSAADTLPPLPPLPTLALPDIVPSQPSDRAAVTELLVAAFERDPVARWFWPDEAVYRGAFAELVHALGGGAFEHGTAYHTSGYESAALWLPPGVAPDEAAIGALVERTVDAGQRPAAYEIFEQMGRAHPEEPHWYLPFIGVHPRLHGRGLGGRLLEVSMRSCGTDERPAYLESTNARNVPLYRRHGFEVTGKIHAGSCPPLDPMIRVSQ